MGKLSEENIMEMFSSEEFNQNYKIYKKQDKCMEFVKFINKIELNTKYFRLTTNNKIGRNKRFKNKNCSDDTICLKEINSYLNKLTDKNTDVITDLIEKKLAGKEYLRDLIINNVLEKCLVHQNYITYYIDILLSIYGPKETNGTNETNEIIEKNTETIYENINSKDINLDQSDYLQFCDKNKKLDLYIGYSLLITELEKKQIIKDKINPTLVGLIAILKDSEDQDEKYKCIQCLYNILKSYYGSRSLSKRYVDDINGLIENEKSMKIKFKLMDIIERK